MSHRRQPATHSALGGTEVALELTLTLTQASLRAASTAKEESDATDSAELAAAWREGVVGGSGHRSADGADSAALNHVAPGVKVVDGGVGGGLGEVRDGLGLDALEVDVSGLVLLLLPAHVDERSLDVVVNDLSAAARALLDLLLVRGVALDAQLDLLETALAQDVFGHVAVLDVSEESTIQESL